MKTHTIRVAVLRLAWTGGASVLSMGCSDATMSSQGADAWCADLSEVEVNTSAITLPVSGVQIQSAAWVPASEPSLDDEGQRILAIAAHCRVQGQIFARDPSADPINFNLNLPEHWNGRALQSGGGGGGGVVITAPGNKASGRFDPDPLYAEYPLTRGYLTFGSDEGHPERSFKHFANEESLRNAGGEYLVKTKDVMRVVAERAYGRYPERIYLSGESAGGGEVMSAAQRFGEHYDGVVATSPVLAVVPLQLATNVVRTRLVDGFLDEAAIRLIADQTRAACDELDGLKDGVIAQYFECEVAEADLRCTEDNAAGGGCLTDAQLASIHAIRDAWVPPPGVTFAGGWTEFPGYGVTGDEDGALFQYRYYTVGTVAPSRSLPTGLGLEMGVGGSLFAATVYVRHAIAQDPSVEPYNFDPTPYAQRILHVSELMDATNPHLEALHSHGGKMIILQPSADNAAPATMVARYVRSVHAAMGADAARVIKLYVTPGGGHNVVGTSQADVLSMLEDWVEQGIEPPDHFVAEDVDPMTLQVRRAMPACAYPQYARYVGGAPEVAESYECTARPDPMDRYR